MKTTLYLSYVERNKDFEKFLISDIEGDWEMDKTHYKFISSPEEVDGLKDVIRLKMHEMDVDGRFEVGFEEEEGFFERADYHYELNRDNNRL